MPNPPAPGRAIRGLLAVAVACLAQVAAAAVAADAPRRFAAPAAAEAARSTGGGIAQMTLSLVLVLALIVAVAWILRRLRGVQGSSRGAGIEVVAELAVGPRERVVLIEVAGERLLIGVAQGSVRPLQSLRRPGEG